MRREILMNQNPKMQQAEPRPFWQQYLMILAVVTIIVILGALLLGNIGQISNLYFLSTFVLLIIAAVPIFFEVGTRVGSARKSIISSGEPEDQEKIKARQSKFDQGARITYLFGLAAITTFILAAITLGVL